MRDTGGKIPGFLKSDKIPVSIRLRHRKRPEILVKPGPIGHAFLVLAPGHEIMAFDILCMAGKDADSVDKTPVNISRNTQSAENDQDRTLGQRQAEKQDGGKYKKSVNGKTF